MPGLMSELKIPKKATPYTKKLMRLGMEGRSAFNPMPQIGEWASNALTRRNTKSMVSKSLSENFNKMVMVKAPFYLNKVKAGKVPPSTNPGPKISPIKATSTFGGQTDAPSEVAQTRYSEIRKLLDPMMSSVLSDSVAANAAGLEGGAGAGARFSEETKKPEYTYGEYESTVGSASTDPTESETATSTLKRLGKGLVAGAAAGAIGGPVAAAAVTSLAGASAAMSAAGLEVPSMGNFGQYFSGQFHFPGMNYCGPGTRDFNKPPTCKLDQICRQHDLDYSEANGDERSIRMADETMLAEMKRMTRAELDQSPRLANASIGAAIKAKVALENAGVLSPGFFGGGQGLDPSTVAPFAASGPEQAREFAERAEEGGGVNDPDRARAADQTLGLSLDQIPAPGDSLDEPYSDDNIQEEEPVIEEEPRIEGLRPMHRMRRPKIP